MHRGVRSGLVASFGIAAVAILVAFLAGVLATHQLWYDCLTLEQKTVFWTGAAVAWGTLALALVTVASVIETQQVTAGEDRRFQQSRMPAVIVQRAHPAPGGTGVTLAIQNVGSGPALDVRLNFRARVRHLNRDAPEFQHADRLEELVEKNRWLVFSYLAAQTGSDDALTWITIPYPDPPRARGLVETFTVELLQLEYRDVFRADYSTSYHGWNENPRNFEWTVPPHLVPP
jgi:hypothetical protein